MLSLYRSNSISTRLGNPLSRHVPHKNYRSTSIKLHATSTGEQSLVDWVIKGNGTINNVKIHRFLGADGASGYGLKASQSITRGTTLITLPSSLQLSYNSTSTDPRLLQLIDQVPTELWGAKLALQLLSHRLHGENNHFSSYIANLPVGFPGLPLFFSPDAVKALSYPPVTSQITRRCRWLIDFASNNIAPLRNTPADDPFQSDDIIDANVLGWALAAVTSRAFRIGGMDRPASMLPLIDMANHSFTPNAKIVLSSNSSGNSSSGNNTNNSTNNTAAIQSGGGSSISMVALRDIDPDEPILISYGNLPNDFLLLDYGFIIPDNPYDTVQLRFDRMLIEAGKMVANVGSTMNVDDDSGDDGVDALEVLPSWQAEALSSIGLYGQTANTEVNILNNNINTNSNTNNNNTSTSTIMNCPVDARFLAGTRILCAANASELQNKKGIDALGQWNTPLSLRNEIAAIQTLTGVCAVALSQFPGSVDDDVAIVKSGGVSDDVMLAVRFRLEKKRLLTRALNVLSMRLAELKNEKGNSGGGNRNSKSSSSTSTGKKKGFGK